MAVLLSGQSFVSDSFFCGSKSEYCPFFQANIVYCDHSYYFAILLIMIINIICLFSRDGLQEMLDMHNKKGLEK